MAENATANLGFRPQYEDGYYAAFVIDPDGHNIEAVYSEKAKVPPIVYFIKLLKIALHILP